MNHFADYSQQASGKCYPGSRGYGIPPLGISLITYVVQALTEKEFPAFRHGEYVNVV